jgi:hypothetical protein
MKSAASDGINKSSSIIRAPDNHQIRILGLKYGQSGHGLSAMTMARRPGEASDTPVTQARGSRADHGRPFPMAGYTRFGHHIEQWRVGAYGLDEE